MIVQPGIWAGAIEWIHFLSVITLKKGCVSSMTEMREQRRAWLNRNNLLKKFYERPLVSHLYNWIIYFRQRPIQYITITWDSKLCSWGSRCPLIFIHSRPFEILLAHLDLFWRFSLFSGICTRFKHYEISTSVWEFRWTWFGAIELSMQLSRLLIELLKEGRMLSYLPPPRSVPQLSDLLLEHTQELFFLH